MSCKLIVIVLCVRVDVVITFVHVLFKAMILFGKFIIE